MKLIRLLVTLGEDLDSQEIFIMVATLNDTQRKAIAMKLADMKVLQNQLIANEQKFISAITDGEIT